MATNTKKMAIRLAMREEGHWWKAYLALTNTMTSAKLIGKISIGAVKKNPEFKARFQALMQDVVVQAIEETTGQKPDHWDTTPAPQGNA